MDITARNRQAVTVYYDGACPLCQREISFYRRRRGSEKVCWVDVSDTDAEVIAPDLTRREALARFHVRDADGELVSGGVAFARLWREMPGFRSLGNLFSTRPLSWLLDRSYEFFLRFRPQLQSMAQARQTTARDANLPLWLMRDLRSDHAGETGAVEIYRGVLSFARDPGLRTFATDHLATERTHLKKIEAILKPADRSRLLPLWRVSGYLTGAVPALIGTGAVYATIDAVETFVDRHYADQIKKLSRLGVHPELRELLQQCREDELHHRDEARASLARPQGYAARAWRWLVGAGSAVAVVFARRV